jgi:outer membrane protein OmpA-like peptidoglycan-associated protein
MKKIKSLYIIALLVISLFPALKAQQSVNTLYFMENAPLRHKLNPSFQPLSNFYFSLPIMGYNQFGFWNNSLTLKDVVYNNNKGESIFFFHPDGDKNKFYNQLRNNTLINFDTQLNLLGFGFRTGLSYWTFDASLKVEGNVSIPKGLMNLVLFGTKEQDKMNNFDLGSLGADVSAYGELALGYSREINDKWTVGGKVKFLSGIAKLSMINKDFQLSAGIDKWDILADGTINAALPGNLYIDENLDSISYNTPEEIGEWLKPSGIGGAIDLGVEFKIIDQLTLSAAVTDIGFIRWKNNAQNISYKTNYTYKGIENLADFDSEQLFDSIWNDIKEGSDIKKTVSPFNSWLAPKLHLGAEYAFVNDKLSVGLFSKTTVYRKRFYEELTASFNARPVNWFNFALSYSVLNGRASTIGVGLGLRMGPLYWLFAADYLPLQYAGYKLDDLNLNVPVPYNSKAFNIALGFNLTIGNKKDSDRDGVADKFDLCPATPRKIAVDGNGCPVDADGDGVPDYLDQCPDTPVAAYGFVDENGCPLDSDGDGTPDYLDKCPGTPDGVEVDADGCPTDGDGDGIADYIDECPDTPAGVKVDANGCPVDTDGDSVPDYLDQCPDTPADVEIDANGCPIDTDGDGVPDYSDQCPDTPAGAAVDENGCPSDRDGDGVPDYLDNCPTVPGPASNNGCPEITQEVHKLFQRALQGIQFETGKSTIRKSSYGILDEIAGMLKENPDYLIEIQGHTDNTGNEELNMKLSDSRATAVRKYLIDKGIDENRMTSKGYGPTQPVADNKTAEGRAKNRRVEFIVTFEKVTIETITQ